MSWFIMILFLGYMFENLTLLILEMNSRKIKWWEGAAFFLFGVFIDAVRNLKSLWRH
jgi:hypothetical protein